MKWSKICSLSYIVRYIHSNYTTNHFNTYFSLSVTMKLAEMIAMHVGLELPLSSDPCTVTYTGH